MFDVSIHGVDVKACEHMEKYCQDVADDMELCLAPSMQTVFAAWARCCIKVLNLGGNHTKACAHLQCNTFTGTVTYMSPERINSQPYSFPADIW